MKKIQSLLLTVAAAFVAVPALSHEHEAGTIKGAGIELVEKNHAFAGSINENPVFGAFDHEPFGGQIQMRKGEKTLRLELRHSADKVYGGSIQETSKDPRTGEDVQKETTVVLKEIKRLPEDKADFHILVDGQEVVVNVSGESFSNNHFHGPTFSTVVAGKALSFHFTGESCFGYSANILMMIVGAYVHLAK